MSRGRAGVGLAAAAAVLACAPAALAADEGPLPGGRSYELVSPAAKGGNEVIAGNRASLDGDRIAFATSAFVPGLPGATFTETGYVAERTDAGWELDRITTPSLLVPNPSIMDATFVVDFSDDLRTAWTAAQSPHDAADKNMAYDIFQEDGTTVTWLTPRVGGPDDDPNATAWLGGRSADGAAIVFESRKPLSADGPTTRAVYLRRNGVTRLVSVLPDGTPATNTQLGTGAAINTQNGGSPPERRAVSADGTRVVFSDENAAGRQVYLWQDGKPTEQLTLSRRAGSIDDPASTSEFQSASADGSVVYFTSPDQLTDGATSGGGLYRYDVGTDALSFVTVPVSGSADVAGTVRVSEDGEVVYLVANGRLTADAPADTQPKLYRLDHGSMRYVTTLVLQDATDLWALGTGESHHAAQITPDGERLVFLSRAPIDGFDAKFKPQVYLYDAAADTLACLSCNADGVARGEGSLHDRWVGLTGGYNVTRNFTADGERVLFETSEALVEADADEKFDVYAYEDGEVTLLTPGTDDDAYLIDQGADGETVFIRTRSSLVPQDDDRGYADVYALRPGPGLPAGETEEERCAGEACRGPQTPAPGVPGAATSVYVGPGNPVLAPDGGKPPAAQPAKLTAAKLGSTALAQLVARGRTTVKVTLGTAGKVRVTGTAELGGKRATALTGAATLKRAGTASVTVRLSAAARKALRKRSRITVRLTITSPATSAKATATLVLRKGGSR